MNHKNHGNRQPAGFSGQPAKPEEMTVQWGVTNDGVRLVAIFPRPVENWMMTPEEADSVIAAIKEGQAACAVKAAEFAANPGQANKQ